VARYGYVPITLGKEKMPRPPAPCPVVPREAGTARCRTLPADAPSSAPARQRYKSSSVLAQKTGTGIFPRGMVRGGGRREAFASVGLRNTVNARSSCQVCSSVAGRRGGSGGARRVVPTARPCQSPNPHGVCDDVMRGSRARARVSAPAAGARRNLQQRLARCVRSAQRTATDAAPQLIASRDSEKRRSARRRGVCHVAMPRLPSASCGSERRCAVRRDDACVSKASGE